MKKTFLFAIILLVFLGKGISQNNHITNTSNYSIKIELADSVRTFNIIYANGEEFRKKLMLAWGRPLVFTAGTIEWTPLSLQGIGNNLKITLSDGVETTESTGTVYKSFVDDNTKYSMLNDLQPNQKRKITLVFTDQQGLNVVTTKTIEKAVVDAIDHIIATAW
jgi:hypothetical protein